MGRFPAQGTAILAPRAYSWSTRIRRGALSRNFMLIRKLSLNMPARPDIDANLSRKVITTAILHGSLFDEACPFGAPDPVCRPSATAHAACLLICSRAAVGWRALQSRAPLVP